MKKLLLLLAGTAILFASCETTKEISIQNNGSGTYSATTDLSGLISMAKMSGQGKELEEMGSAKSIDTTIATESMLGLIPNLTAEDQELVKKGALGVTMDMKNDKFVTKLSFPFDKGSQVGRLDNISRQVIAEIMKRQTDSTEHKMPVGLDANSLGSSVDDYYITTYSKGLIERKLDKEKYANVGKDSTMQVLKEMAGMGIGGNTLIFNLPSAVKKAEGKKVILSEDKKKVTLVTSAEDFFDNAADLEFRIEY